MDFNNDSEMWQWQGEDFYLEQNNSLFSEDISYMFDETTPVKDCGDLAYQVAESETMNKGMEHCREASSQAKRRRMLQFDNEVLNVLPPCSENMPSTFLESEECEDSVPNMLSNMSEWVSGFADDSSASGSGYEGLKTSSEGWLADCFNDTEMYYSPEELNPSGGPDVQIDVTELLSSQPEPETRKVAPRPSVRRNIIFKGKKSVIKTPTKLASTVAYPFAIVKPFGMQGDVTLKDINQRILTPPPSKSKKASEDPAVVYPTSAFSGKPVVVKTKIRTEGGKGSITIMRTKG